MIIYINIISQNANKYKKTSYKCYASEALFWVHLHQERSKSNILKGKKQLNRYINKKDFEIAKSIQGQLFLI